MKKFLSTREAEFVIILAIGLVAIFVILSVHTYNLYKHNRDYDYKVSVEGDESIYICEYVKHYRKCNSYTFLSSGCKKYINGRLVSPGPISIRTDKTTYVEEVLSE